VIEGCAQLCSVGPRLPLQLLSSLVAFRWQLLRFLLWGGGCDYVTVAAAAAFFCLSVVPVLFVAVWSFTDRGRALGLYSEGAPALLWPLAGQ